MAEFSREATKVGGAHLVALRGELDIATADGLADWLVDIAGSPVVVDLLDLDFIDSSGVAAFISARQRMAEDGNELILVRPGPIARRAIEVLGLGELISDWDLRWDPG